jgi:hypothetical protein
MSRVVLTDEIWDQLQEIMKSKGCKILQTIAMSWKQFYENLHRCNLARYSRRSMPVEDSLQLIQQMGSQRHVGQLFFSLRREADTEWIFIDGSYLRVHQQRYFKMLWTERS